mmetsp:Transcript_28947/g.86403  ORF Transcript_28947/g.86403 Transcript_28947/m.86403 type:complete len:84 (+) Transcript_28947:121-372(+)
MLISRAQLLRASRRAFATEASRRAFATEAPRPPVPPFTKETAIQKVRAAEDAWNLQDPTKVPLAGRGAENATATRDTSWDACR